MTEAFLKLIFEASVTAGIAAAAVMLIRVPLKKAPKRWSYLLWAVVFFRCLCPFSVESTVSLFNAVPDRSVTAEQDGNGMVNAEVPQTVQQEIVSEGVQYDTPLPSAGTFYNPYGGYGEPRYADYSGYANFEENYSTENTAENIPQTDSTEAVAADTAENGQEKSVSTYTILLIVWLAGVTAMAVYGTVSYARLMRKIRTAVKTEDSVYETDMIPTAFSAGFFPPRVYIPCGLSNTERRLIVTHERVHIRRFDYITKPLAFIALAVHWFNPLIWAAFALMTKDMELSCDEAVLKICGAEEKKDYSRALLRVSMKRSGLAVIPLAFAETGIKGRVKNVLGYKKPRVLATVLAAALVFGSCAVLGTNAKRIADDTNYIALAEGTTEFSGKNGERIFFSFGAPKASGTGGKYYECAFELDGETVQMPYLFWNDTAVNGNLAVHSIISDGTSLSYDDKEFNIGTLVINCVKIDELFVEDDGDTTYMNVKLRVSADDDFDNETLVERLESFFEMNQKDGFEFNIEEAEASEGEYAFDVRADMGEVSGGETVGYSIMLLGFDDIPVYASESLKIVGHAGGNDDVKSADRVLLEKGTTEFIDENGERILFAYGDNEVAIYNGKKETVLEPHLRYRDADGEIRSQFISEGMTLGFKGLEAMSSSGGGIDSIGGGIDIDCGISEITINDIRVNMNDYFYCAAVNLDILADDTLPEKMKCLTWTESCADIDISGGDGRYTVNAEITARPAESGAAEFYALALLGFDDVPVYASENLNIAGHIDGNDTKNADRVLIGKGTTEFEDGNGESVYFAYGDTVTYTSMGDTVETSVLPALRYKDESGTVRTFQVESGLKGLMGLTFSADENGRRSSSSGGVDIDCEVSEITVTDIYIKQDNGSYYVSLSMYILADDTLPEKIGCFTWYDNSSVIDVDGADGRYIVNVDIKIPWADGNSDWVGSAERGECGIVLTGFDDIPVYAAKELKIVGHIGGDDTKTEQSSNKKQHEQFDEFLNDIKSSYPQPILPVADDDIGEYGANNSHMLFAVSKGTEVLAAADGTVKSAEIGFNKGYGNCIEISHVGEMSTLYAHLDEFAVEVGDEVKAGDIIGYSGSSGNTVGDALLFEIRMDGMAQNPWNYFYFSDDGYKRAMDEISKDYVSDGIMGIYNADGTPVFENEQETIEIDGVLYYLISTEEQLRAIAVGKYGMDKNFLQNGDIQLSDKEWLPIGTKEMPFMGSYNGNGYEISGLTMKDPDAVRVGMFGYAENAHIYNITLRDYDIESAGSNAKQISVAPILPVVTNGTRCYDNNV